MNNKLREHLWVFSVIQLLIHIFLIFLYYYYYNNYYYYYFVILQYLHSYCYLSLDCWEMYRLGVKKKVKIVPSADFSKWDIITNIVDYSLLKYTLSCLTMCYLTITSKICTICFAHHSQIFPYCCSYPHD